MEVRISSGHIMLIDEEDIAKLGGGKIHRRYSKDKSERGYARVYLNGKTTSVHRIVMGLSHGDKRQIDHINGNTLDNRKCNLRICSAAENARNARKGSRNTRTKFKGVHWVAEHKKWRAMICVNGKNKMLGYFQSDEAAAAAYDAAAIEHFGEFARTNAMIAQAREVLAMTSASGVM